MKEHEAKQRLLDDARESLIDGAFDAVVLIASWQTEDGMTATVQAHAGNWYAQNGMIQHLGRRREQSAVHEGQQQAQRDDEAASEGDTD